MVLINTILSTVLEIPPLWMLLTNTPLNYSTKNNFLTRKDAMYMYLSFSPPVRLFKYPWKKICHCFKTLKFYLYDHYRNMRSYQCSSRVQCYQCSLLCTSRSHCTLRWASLAGQSACFKRLFTAGKKGLNY